jgi:hypothetical protein
MLKLLLGILIGLAIAFWMFHKPAQAHDFWISGQAVDPITKKLCCGENDCRALGEDEYEIVEGGYRLKDTGEIIAYDRAQPSPDGHTWRCRWGGQTQCFFTGVRGS